jgi:hypothetical protein
LIEKIVNMNRIKFSVLDELFKDKFSKKDKSISIHIDLHSILEPLYDAKNYEETNWLTDKTNTVITSCIINLCAHYRLYFGKNKLASRIYLYFGNEKPRNNSEYYNEYGYKFFDKYSKDNEDHKPINKEIFSSLKLIKTIVTYIPGVYYIDCKNIEPMNSCSYMITNDPDDFNLVLSKDSLWFQTISLSKTEVLRLKRDESFLITRENVIDILLKGFAYENQFVNYELLSVLFSFAGIKSRDIKGLSGYGYAKIIKILDLAIERGILRAKYTHIKNVIDEIYNGNQSEYLMNVFRAIDLTFQLNNLTTAQKTSLTDCIKDKFNKRDLLRLNQLLFTGENSLMLDELFKYSDEVKPKTIKW